MIGSRPNFMDSPYFVMEEDNWHLKEGAPAEVVKEFNEYMQETEIKKPVKKSFNEKMQDLLKDFPKYE